MDFRKRVMAELNHAAVFKATRQPDGTIMSKRLAPRERFELPRERAHAISSRAHYQAMRSRLSHGDMPSPFNHHP